MPPEQPLAPTLIAPDEGRAALPRSIAPMRPRIASAPFNSDEHLFEVKWDGIRAQLARDPEGIRLTDRRGGDLLKLVPEMRRYSHPVLGHSTISVGTITGGSKTNIAFGNAA